MSFRIPTLFFPRHSFRRLRSFHLSPNALPQSTPSLSNKEKKASALSVDALKDAPRNVSIPLRGAIITKLAVVVSLIFIFTISFSFIGAEVDEQNFLLSLRQTANINPGLVLLGESVDVDVDEPSITIRWSIMACGEQLVLPGSSGAHGVSACGLPTQALYIFVDNDSKPTATYNPDQIPFSRSTGSRRSIQDLVQFDSDHVLDVHEAHLYPFDTYVLSSTVRAVSFTNETLPIRKIVTIDTTSNFNIDTVDIESYGYSPSPSDVEYTSRDFDMRVTRPGSARLFVLLLFALNWILAHVAVGLVMMCRKLEDIRPILKYMVPAGAIVLVIPQFRNSMPDAPGFDGFLIDNIGYFPQMIFAGVSAAVILLILISRELDEIRQTPAAIPVSQYPRPPPAALNRIRPPPSPTKDSSSSQVFQYEKRRTMRHLEGEYVFPPVQLTRPTSASQQVTPHRRTRTMPGISEGSEASHYSEWVE